MLQKALRFSEHAIFLQFGAALFCVRGKLWTYFPQVCIKPFQTKGCGNHGSKQQPKRSILAAIASVSDIANTLLSKQFRSRLLRSIAYWPLRPIRCIAVTGQPPYSGLFHLFRTFSALLHQREDAPTSLPPFFAQKTSRETPKKKKKKIRDKTKHSSQVRVSRHEIFLFSSLFFAFFALFFFLFFFVIF